MTNENKPAVESILFFDGVCGLCNKFVDFLLSKNKRGGLKFATLQGTTASQKLDATLILDFNTVVLLTDNKVYKKSSAALRSLAALGGPWRLCLGLLIIPKFIRDFVYDQVAKNRYEVFGKREICRLPTEEERSHFLD